MHQCGHAGGVTFNPDGELWLCRSVVGSLIVQDRNLGSVG